LPGAKIELRWTKTEAVLLACHLCVCKLKRTTSVRQFIIHQYAVKTFEQVIVDFLLKRGNERPVLVAFMEINVEMQLIGTS
jgi:hypothetical protein